jgi:hypothetical protein
MGGTRWLSLNYPTSSTATAALSATNTTSLPRASTSTTWNPMTHLVWHTTIRHYRRKTHVRYLTKRGLPLAQATRSPRQLLYGRNYLSLELLIARGVPRRFR